MIERRRKSFVRVAAVMSAVVLGLAACGSGSGDSEGGGDDPIKIGLVLPLSGQYASEGQEIKRGHEMALAEFGGEVAGRKVELVFGDGFTPEDVVAETNRLATRENVDLFVGSYATVASRAGSEASARHELAWFETHANTDALAHRGLESYFRVGPNASSFADVAVNFIVEGLGDKLGGGKKVFLEHEDGEYGTLLSEQEREGLESAGFTIVGQGKHKVTATDFTDSVLKAKKANPDVWLLTGYAPDYSLLLRTAAAQGFKPKAIIMIGTGDAPSTYEAVGAEALTGAFVVSYGTPLMNSTYAPGNDKFYADFKKRYGSDPLGSVASTAYAGMTSALNILEKSEGKTDLASLGDVARSIDIPMGGLPNGWGVQFDENRENVRARPLIIQWRQDGTIPAVWPAEAALPDQKIE